MSNRARCGNCNHVKGGRSTAPMAQADKAPKPHGEQPKKAPCSCECHGAK